MLQVYSEQIELDYGRLYPPTISIDEIENFYRMLRTEAYTQSKFKKNQDIQDWLHNNGITTLEMSIECCSPTINSMNHNIVLHFKGVLKFNLTIDFPDENTATLFKLTFQGML